jgi:hypothetical protein
MYTPKKMKWNCLVDFRDHLVTETQEKIVSFDGWRLITENAQYTMSDGKLFVDAPSKPEPLPESKPEPKPAAKLPESKPEPKSAAKKKRRS